jgi:four helix bundle protein
MGHGRIAEIATGLGSLYRENCDRSISVKAQSLKALVGLNRARLVSVQKSRDVRVRSFQFAVDAVTFGRLIMYRDPILRRLVFQLVDAAGSIGANLQEAAEAQSKRDFIAKNCIALKEARESRFWLMLIASVETVEGTCSGADRRSVRTRGYARGRGQNCAVEPWTWQTDRDLAHSMAPGPWPIPHRASAQLARARFSNLVCSLMNASLTTPVGPLRCLPTMISATPSAS